MPIDIADVTFIAEEDLAPVIDLEIQVDEIRVDLVKKQNELRRELIKLRRNMGLKMSDKIDLAQGIAIPIEKAIESSPEQNGTVA